MSWSIFVWTVIPSGAALTVMMASGWAIVMWTGSKVLSAPISMGNTQLSLGSVMTAICLILTILSYSALRRCEARAEIAAATVARDQQMRDVFHQGRNLYLSLLGLVLWATAWRLKALYDARQLGPPKRPRRAARGSVARGIFFATGLLALFLGDIPLCRLNYHVMLQSTVTPKKAMLMPMAMECQGIKLTSSGGQCARFCQDVRELSEARNDAIMWARKWHVLGRWAAEMFDDRRDMQQGSSRIDALFDRKSCGEVLRSVDKSNTAVNVLCYFLAGVSIIGAFTAFATMSGEDGSGNNHED